MRIIGQILIYYRQINIYFMGLNFLFKILNIWIKIGIKIFPNKKYTVLYKYRSKYTPS